MLFNDRIYSGNSNEENSKEYILHELFLKNSTTHSHLQKIIPKLFRPPKEIDVENLISNLTEKLKISKNSNSEYTVKKEFWKELNIYYSNYLTRDLQDVELNFKNFFNRNEEIKLKYPIKTPFKSLNNLKFILSSKTFFNLIFIILFRSLKNKITSKLLNSILHSIIYILKSENENNIFSKEKEDFTKKFKSFNNENEIKSYKDIKFPFNSLKKNLKIKIILPNFSIFSLLLEIRKKDDLLNEQKVFIDSILELIGKEEEQKLENERERKLREAKERQKKIENSFLNQMNQFDESMFLDDEEEEEGISGVSDEENDHSCVFCHSKSSPSGNSKFGFISHISKSESVSFTSELNYIESKEGSFNYDNLKNVKNEDIPWKKQIDENSLLPLDIGEFNELFSNVNKQHGIQLNSCRHVCHFDCFHNYYMSLLQKNSFKGDWCLFLEHSEVLCPVR